MLPNIQQLVQESVKKPQQTNIESSKEDQVDFSKMLRTRIDFNKVKQKFMLNRKKPAKSSESDSSSSSSSSSDENEEYDENEEFRGLQRASNYDDQNHHDFEKEFEDDHRIEHHVENSVRSELLCLASDIHKTFNSDMDEMKNFNEKPLNDDQNDDLKEIIDDECLMPQFDWAALEAKLKESSQLESQVKILK